MQFDYICFGSDWTYEILKDITSNLGHGHSFSFLVGVVPFSLLYSGIYFVVNLIILKAKIGCEPRSLLRKKIVFSLLEYTYAIK